METRNYSNFNQAVKKGVLIFGSLSFLFNLYAIVVLNKSAAPMDLVHILPGFVVNAIWEGLSRLIHQEQCFWLLRL